MYRICCRSALGIACLTLLALQTALAATGVINAIDQGALGDGTTLNTAAFRKSVAACVKQKGGTIYVPAGIYRTGPIQLQSNITLRLEAGAVLLGSEVVADYRVDGGRSRPLVWAENAVNMAICGLGTIDGRGDTFMHLDKPRTEANDFERRFTRQGEDFMSPKFGTSDGPVTYSPRPNRLVAFYNCKHVTMRDVLLKDAPCWTLNFADCAYVDVDGVKVLNNPVIPNNDGFRGRQPNSEEAHAAIILDSVRGAIVRNSQAAEGTTTFLMHRDLTEAGLFGNNDVTRAAIVIDPQPSPFVSSSGEK